MALLNSPWRMKLVSIEDNYYDWMSGVAGQKVCFSAFVDPVAAGLCDDSRSSCCRTNFGKFQLEADSICLHAIQDVYVNNVYTAAVSLDESRKSIKFTNLNFSYTQGMTTDISICFTLQNSSPCPNLQRLCNGGFCRYAIFNGANHDCCPIGLFDSSF